MRSKPYATSFNTNSYDKMALKEPNAITYEGDISVKLPPISQVDCLALHRVDIGSLEREREIKIARITERQKRTITRPVQERQFEFGRKKKRQSEYPDGNVPPISQIVMGPSGDSDIRRPRPRPKPRYQEVKRRENVNLPAISQVSCLGGPLNEDRPRLIPSKFQIGDMDSNYVKLAKSGGHSNLLHYVEAGPTLKRSRNIQYKAGSNGTLPALKTKSVEDPTWKPSQWPTLLPIKKQEGKEYANGKN